MKLSRGEKLLLLAVALAIVHHVDHVLRVDHSGWPFASESITFHLQSDYLPHLPLGIFLQA